MDDLLRKIRARHSPQSQEAKKIAERKRRKYEYERAYYEKHKDYLLAYGRAYRSKNKDYEKARNAKRFPSKKLKKKREQLLVCLGAILEKKKKKPSPPDLPDPSLENTPRNRKRLRDRIKHAIKKESLSKQEIEHLQSVYRNMLAGRQRAFGLSEAERRARKAAYKRKKWHSDPTVREKSYRRRRARQKMAKNLPIVMLLAYASEVKEKNAEK